MQVERTDWQKWARKLQQWKLNEPAAVLLETTGPLAVVLAQIMYFSSPLVEWTMPAGQWENLAKLLENRDERQIFATILRERESGG